MSKYLIYELPYMPDERAQLDKVLGLLSDARRVRRDPKFKRATQRKAAKGDALAAAALLIGG